MESNGQGDHHVNAISRLASMRPAAFLNAWASDCRERYMMDMHASSDHGRPSFNRTGSTTTSSYHQQHPSLELSSPVWQHRHVPGADTILGHHHHRVHSLDNNNNSSSSNLRGGGSSSLRMTAMLGSPDSMSRGSPASLQSTSSELYDNSSSPVVTGDWQQFVDSDGRYSSLRPPTSSSGNVLQQQSSSSSIVGGGGSNEGAMIRELIGRLGGSNMGSSNNGGSLLSSSPSPSQQHAGGGVEGLAALNLGGGNHGCWNSSNATAVVEMTSNAGGLTVDPCKGGLSLNGAVVGSGHTTSHCLPPFAADPGFAERAARFSSFSNGNYTQPFSSSNTEGGGGGTAKMRSRSSASPLSENSKHLSRTSSCPPVRESAGIITNDSSPPERRPDSGIIRETHSGLGVSDDVLASEAAAADDDENSGEGNYPQSEGKSLTKMLSRRACHLLGAASHTDDEEEEEPPGGTTLISTNTSFDPGTIRGFSTSSPEQAGSAGLGEASPSSGVSGGDIAARKRKTGFEERPHNKHLGSVSTSSHAERDAKTAETDDANAKRFRRGEGFKDRDEMRSKAERCSSETSEESSPRSVKDHSKPSEAPKPDYIHVRARRGQATDSHSLAERVRREKISERMKFLQDLVPGCSKVTGKAVMLDEIINYVQSLQRQVEFLSMKLASVNPRLDYNLENFLGKEGPHVGSQAMILGAEPSMPYPPMHSQQHRAQLQQGLEYQLHSEATLRRSMSMPIPAAIHRSHDFEESGSQTMWDDGELQSIVQMGFGHAPCVSSQALHCHLPPGQVKVELQQSPISCL